MISKSKTNIAVCIAATLAFSAAPEAEGKDPFKVEVTNPETVSESRWFGAKSVVLYTAEVDGPNGKFLVPMRTRKWRPTVQSLWKQFGCKLAQKAGLAIRPYLQKISRWTLNSAACETVVTKKHRLLTQVLQDLSPDAQQSLVENHAVPLTQAAATALTIIEKNQANDSCDAEDIKKMKDLAQNHPGVTLKEMDADRVSSVLGNYPKAPAIYESLLPCAPQDLEHIVKDMGRTFNEEQPNYAEIKPYKAGVESVLVAYIYDGGRYTQGMQYAAMRLVKSVGAAQALVSFQALSNHRFIYHDFASPAFQNMQRLFTEVFQNEKVAKAIGLPYLPPTEDGTRNVTMLTTFLTQCSASTFADPSVLGLGDKDLTHIWKYIKTKGAHWFLPLVLTIVKHHVWPEMKKCEGDTEKLQKFFKQPKVLEGIFAQSLTFYAKGIAAKLDKHYAWKEFITAGIDAEHESLKSVKLTV